jgi:transposase
MRWYELIGKDIVYLDESGFAVDSPRRYGYSTVGQRCYGDHNWHEKGRLNAIGAIVNFELIAIDLWDGTINSDVFYAWVHESLLPALPDQSVVVLDGAPFHKRSDIAELITNDGHTIRFLPSYSPDLNPIEKKWAEAKAIRRKERCNPWELFLHDKL